MTCCLDTYLAYAIIAARHFHDFLRGLDFNFITDDDGLKTKLNQIEQHLVAKIKFDLPLLPEDMKTTAPLLLLKTSTQHQ